MALYAFDGTWNSDKPGTAKDTNVMWFKTAYGPDVEYVAGIGAHFDKNGVVTIDEKENPFSKIVGGITGAGGHNRVKEMLKRVGVRQKNNPGDPVDVIGFSRGSALAVDFVNRMAKQYPKVPVRFLGLWDMVPSFGVSLIGWDPTWKLDLPDTVQKCYHAMALDERRPDFHLRRPKAKRVDQLVEVWFRGVHSDVGGGNSNAGRSSIALDWMYAKAIHSGVTIPAGPIAENRDRIDEEADISKHAKFWLELGARRVNRADLVHASVLQKMDGESREYVKLSGLSVLFVNNDDQVVLHSHMDQPD